jgi:hypothetical protein
MGCFKLQITPKTTDRSHPSLFLHPQADCSRSSTAVRALLRSWRAASPAHAARALGSSADELLDLAPALRDLSRPASVRAVASQLLSRDEDRVLTHVVSSSRLGLTGWCRSNRTLNLLLFSFQYE